MRATTIGMNATHLREQLHEYIEHADTRKLKAIYTILEKEIRPPTPAWPEEWVEELDRRAAELDSGQTKAMTIEQVREAAAPHLKRNKK